MSYLVTAERRQETTFVLNAMKHNLLVLLLLIVVLSCKGKKENSTQYNPQQTLELRENIDEYFLALNNMGKFNGVVYAAKNEEEILSKAYNLNPNESSSTYVDIESQFDIHSVSKLMAHYVIEKFELADKVRKSQSVSEYVPDFPDGNLITIEMLLNHTAGLPRRFDNLDEDAINLTSEQIIEYAKKQKLIFSPGSDQQYSNIGYEIVYYIIEEISKKTFAQCLFDEVFQPLSMQNSGAHFYLQDKNIQNLAKNHWKNDSVIVQVDNILSDEFKTARIFSTATDLHKFLKHIKKEPYASLLKNDDGVIEKSGGSDGIRVEIYTDLEHNYDFVFLANYEGIPFQKTIEDFAKILEYKPYEVPKELNRKAISIPLEVIEKYLGTYSFADMGNLELSFMQMNGDLVVFQDGELIATLKPETESVFYADPKEPESFEFIKNKKGRFDVLMGWKGVKLKGIKK